MNGRTKCWIVGILAFLLLLGLNVYTLTQCQQNRCKCNNEVANVLESNGGLKTKDVEQLNKELEKKVKESEIAFKINASPVVKGGEANLLIESPEKNINLMGVEIYEDETNRLLYKSDGLLKPDSHIAMAPLLVKLDKGEHKATAVFKAYNPNKPDEFRGQTQVSLTIYAE